MIAYKLFRIRRNGTAGSLFINRRQVIPFGTWLQAEDHPTKNFAHRPGWHCCEHPVAPHLSMKDRIWCAVEIEDFVPFTRPAAQGGLWYLAQRMKVLHPIVVQDVPEIPGLHLVHCPPGVAILNPDAIIRITEDEVAHETDCASKPVDPPPIKRHYPYNSQPK